MDAHLIVTGIAIVTAAVLALAGLNARRSRRRPFPCGKVCPNMGACDHCEVPADLEA